MQNNQRKFSKERTLVLIKPDAIQRSLIGEIVSRFERVGLKIVALKIFVPTEEEIRQQYAPSKEAIIEQGKRSIAAQAKLGRKIKKPPYEHGMEIFNRIKRFMLSGPSVAMILEGNQAVEIVKKLAGATEPLSSNVGTIRGDYTLDSYEMADADDRSVRNLIHRSASKEEAKGEIKIWFKSEEILDYRLISEKILYDINLDGILE